MALKLEYPLFEKWLAGFYRELKDMLPETERTFENLRELAGAKRQVLKDAKSIALKDGEVMELLKDVRTQEHKIGVVSRIGLAARAKKAAAELGAKPHEITEAIQGILTADSHIARAARTSSAIITTSPPAGGS